MAKPSPAKLYRDWEVPLIMHAAKRSLVWAVLASTLTIVGCEVQSASKSEVQDAWKVRTIHRDDYQASEYGPDMVELNNGEKIRDLGYNVRFVGEIPRQAKAPILLFYAIDCVECEPGHFIITYSPESRERIRLFHPGEWLGIDAMSDFEVVTNRTRLFYGTCMENWSGILLFQEGRHIGFEEGKWIVPETWKRSTKQVSIGATGALHLKKLEGQAPAVEEVLPHVQKDVCHEVAAPGGYMYL